MDTYTFDAKGNAVDPPVIADYERRIDDAAALADSAEVERLTKEYRTARNKLARDRNTAASKEDKS